MHAYKHNARITADWKREVMQNILLELKRDDEMSDLELYIMKDDDRVALVADNRSRKVYYCLSRRYGTFPAGTLLGEGGLDSEWQVALQWASSQNPH